MIQVTNFLLKNCLIIVYKNWIIWASFPKTEFQICHSFSALINTSKKWPVMVLWALDLTLQWPDDEQTFKSIPNFGRLYKLKYPIILQGPVIAMLFIPYFHTPKATHVFSLIIYPYALQLTGDWQPLTYNTCIQFDNLPN